MSTHVVTNPASVTEGYPGLLAAATLLIRAPSLVAWDGSSVVYTFTPDLTAGEATTFADLLATMRTHDVDLTPEEYAALKPFLATGRAFLGLSQADFIALGQNARDRMLHENVSALWRVIFRLLRD